MNHVSMTSGFMSDKYGRMNPASHEVLTIALSDSEEGIVLSFTGINFTVSDFMVHVSDQEYAEIVRKLLRDAIDQIDFAVRLANTRNKARSQR